MLLAIVDGRTPDILAGVATPAPANDVIASPTPLAPDTPATGIGGTFGSTPTPPGVPLATPGTEGVPIFTEPIPVPPDALPLGDPGTVDVPPPEGLAAILAVVSPFATPVCGLGGVLGFLLDVAGVPVDLSEAVAVVYLACGAIPLPSERTICPVDGIVLGIVNEATGGVVPLPAPMGATIDSIRAVERVVASLTGLPVPGLSAALVAALGCSVDGL